MRVSDIPTGKSQDEKNVIAPPGPITSLLKKPHLFTMKSYKEILEKYIPDPALELVYGWLVGWKVQLKITRSRSTKLGDYRSPLNGNGHRISINHDLNPYSFLITLIHELAHLIVWEKFGNKVKPHGKEWKSVFGELMGPVMKTRVFPEDVEEALRKYLKNARAASGSDITLTKVLLSYDKKTHLMLEDLPAEAVFRIHNGREFRKGEKLRKRYRCVCLHSRKNYLINPLMKVYPAEKL